MTKCEGGATVDCPNEAIEDVTLYTSDLSGLALCEECLADVEEEIWQEYICSGEYRVEDS